MPTRYTGTAREIRALNAYITLVRACDSVLARTQGLFSEFDLTPGQFGVMEALYHCGPACQSLLGRKLLRTGGNITFVVDGLERRGLARRERGTEDRRFITVHLTRDGESLLRRVLPAHVEAIVRELSVLSAAEQQTLRVLCRRLGKGGDCEL